ncbi:plasmid stabilization protein [Desulfitobacterium hafniense]|uniref:Plasmid stabilization protein n=1 Tax=Desulfitobacterium hafniense TaxID=49338 RepID=A0A0W1JIC8_DESHA|nr:type II toxin-antitoxin system RelE/ParE family toxin [Desulfitobacterium hafniense]KTE91436.1 plasmid stabilization protein [Desulfitobacterium hafniense]
MNLTYQLTLNRDSVKFIAKQERATQERIRKALIGLAIRPPIGDIRPLKGQGKLMRLRVGTYRVIFEVNHTEQTVYILTIDNRGDIY